MQCSIVIALCSCLPHVYYHFYLWLLFLPFSNLSRGLLHSRFFLLFLLVSFWLLLHHIFMLHFLSCLCLLLFSCLFFLFNPLFPFLLILLHIPFLSYNGSLKCYFHSSILIWALVLLSFFLLLLTYAHISAFVLQLLTSSIFSYIFCPSFSLHNILYSSLYYFILFYTFLLFILLYPSYVILVLLFWPSQDMLSVPFSFLSIPHPTTLVPLFFFIFARVASINSIMQFDERAMIAVEHSSF